MTQANMADSTYKNKMDVCSCRSLELRALSPDAWFSDGVAYPRLTWLATDLLPKLVRWASECKSSEFRSTLSLLPVEKYSLTYQQLKEKYRNLVKVKSPREPLISPPLLRSYSSFNSGRLQVWPEVTDPEKFVYEDVAIATYLLVSSNLLVDVLLSVTA